MQTRRLGIRTLSILLALPLAGCATLPSATTPRSGPIAWTDGVPGATDADCPAFDAVTGGDGGWWFSGPDCLIYAAVDERQAAIYPFRSADWRLDRVDGLVAGNDGVVWAAGRQRAETSVRAVIGEFRAGRATVDSPERWGLSGVLVNAFAGPRGGAPWAVGRRMGAGPSLFVAHWEGEAWTALDTARFGAGELLDVDFAADGCGWFVGRDSAGAGVLIRYDGSTLRKEVLDRADGVPTRVAALSCSDLWLGGHSAIRYAEGHREEIQFGENAELNGLAVCPDGDLLLVGERIATEPEMEGRRVGFSFRVRGGGATVLPVQLPFAVDDWRLADVSCDADGAWAVGAAVARVSAATSPERRALVLRLGEDGWRYRGWAYR